MLQILGEYDCTIDSKGRIKLPSLLLKQLANSKLHSFVVNRGFEQCLILYPLPTWEKISEEVNQLNQYEKKNRDFLRYFYRGASPVAADAADRILIPNRLLEYAAVQKELVLFAYGDKIEIWAAEVHQKMLDEQPVDFSNLAEEVLGKK